MCAICGCSATHEHGHDRGDHSNDHHHDHDADHTHAHARAAASRTVRLERDLLARNAAIARENRAWLARRGVVALNLVSAPGSGKTTLLEATLRALAGRMTISVLEGDQETERDAARIRAAGGRAIQINTGTGCHLDAHTVGQALAELDPSPGSLVVIENVGNLVCPALFDLGERAKVVLLSVTEGEDKPLKYPHMFRASETLVLNKVDLLPHLTFDVERCLEHARAVSPRLRVVRLSATSGEGLDGWTRWLAELFVKQDPTAAAS